MENFRKIHYEDYWVMPHEEKETICQKEKQDLRNFVNSEAFSHINLLKDKLITMEGII